MSTINNNANFYLNNQIRAFEPIKPDAVKTAIMAEIPQQYGGFRKMIQPSVASVAQIQSAADKAFAKGDNNLGIAINNIKVALQNGDKRLDSNGDGQLSLGAAQWPKWPWTSPGAVTDELTAFSQIAGSTQNNMNEFLDNSDFGIIPPPPVVPQEPQYPTLPSTGLNAETLLRLLLSQQSSPSLGYNNSNSGLNSYGGNQWSQTGYGNQITYSNNTLNGFGYSTPYSHTGSNGFDQIINIINNFFGKRPVQHFGFQPTYTSVSATPQIQYPGALTTGFTGW